MATNDKEIDDWEALPSSSQDSGVDDWESKPVAHTPDVGVVESGLRGAVQGLTFDFADEITAGAESLFTDKTYEESLQESRQAYEEARKANPKTYFGGELLGSMALPVPGAAALKAGSTAAKIGKAALMGAGVGGLSAAGRTTKDLTSTEGLKEVATGALIGGAIGGAVPAGMKAGSKLKQKFSQKLDDLASPKAIAEALPTTPKQRAKELIDPKLMEKKVAAVKTGQELGVFEGSAISQLSPQKTIQKVQTQLDKAGKTIGDNVKAVDDTLSFVAKQQKQTPAEMLLDSVRKHFDLSAEALQEKGRTGELSQQELNRAIDNLAANFSVINKRIESKPHAVLEAVRDVRQGLEKKLRRADFQPGGTKAGTAKDNLKTTADLLRGAEREVVDMLDDWAARQPGLEKQSRGAITGTYKKALDDYSNLETLQHELSQVKDIKWVSLEDVLYGAVGGFYGLPVVALRKAYTVSQTPQGKVVLNRFLSKKSPKADQNFSKMFKIPMEVIKQFDTPKARQQFIKALEQQIAAGSAE